MKVINNRQKEEKTSLAQRFSSKRKVEGSKKSPKLLPPRTRSRLKKEIELESSTNPQYESYTNCDKGPLNLQKVVNQKELGWDST